MGYHCLRIMVLTERKPSEILPHFSSEGLPGFEDSYYFNARWYDPEIGGFITEDPIRDGLLHYTYVNNNPMRFVDPDGLEYININRYGNQQEAKGHLPGGASLEKQGCYIQTAANIVNTLRGRNDLSPLSTDVVNNYTKKINGAYTDDGRLTTNGLIKLVEHLSGYKMESEDESKGKDDVLEAANGYDDSEEEYIGILKTDFENDEGDITKSHFMGLNNASKDDLGISDSSNTERQGLDDLLDNEEVGRLDTYSFSYTGNFGDYFREKDYYEDDEDDQDQRNSKPKRRREK